MPSSVGSPQAAVVVADGERLDTDRSQARQRLPSEAARAKEDDARCPVSSSSRSRACLSRSITDGIGSERMRTSSSLTAGVSGVAHSGSGRTIMLSRNSSRSRNGQRSSSGLDTNDPSGRCIDDRRGARTSSGMTCTSQTTGPGHLEHAPDVPAEVGLIGDDDALAGCRRRPPSTMSGTVRPVRESHPMFACPK